MPTYHQHSADLGTTSRHSTPVSSAPHGRHEQDRTATTPSFSPSTPMDSSHGCNTSLASDDGPRTNLQPHEFVSNNNNNKHEKHITTIYTKNTQGLWRCPRDADGNILVDKPPDLSKLEYLIDYMRQKWRWLVAGSRNVGRGRWIWYWCQRLSHLPPQCDSWWKRPSTSLPSRDYTLPTLLWRMESSWISAPNHNQPEWWLCWQIHPYEF